MSKDKALYKQLFRTKKLILALIIFLLIAEAKTKNILLALKQILCIYYPVEFKKNNI